MAKIDTEKKEIVALKEGDAVKMRDDVDIVYTDKAQFHSKGEKATVHRNQAAILINKGFAQKA